MRRDPCSLVGPARQSAEVFDLTRKDLLDHLAFLQRTISYRTCRFHAVFDDDMGVVRSDGRGGLANQWHYVDQVYDALQRLGLKPFVELNLMPTVLAFGSQTMFDYKMNVTPPADWGAWEALVTPLAHIWLSVTAWMMLLILCAGGLLPLCLLKVVFPHPHSVGPTACSPSMAFRKRSTTPSTFCVNSVVND